MQSCSNCESEYDAVHHIPRILISCGHTYCQVCICNVIQEELEAKQHHQQQQAASTGRAINKGSTNYLGKKGVAKKDLIASSSSAVTANQAIVFECFECGIPCQVDPKIGVNALPKNMVLIPPASSSHSTDVQTNADISTTGATKPTQGRTNLKQTASSQSVENIGANAAADLNDNTQLQSQEESSLLNIADSNDLSQSMNRDEPNGIACCKLHPTKKIEAFCEKDYKLLCIDCILSDRHKNHEIISIAKASEKHQTYLRTQQEASMSVAQKLISSKNEIERHMQLMKLQAEQNRRELSVLYNAIRDMLMQREQSLKTYISEVYEKEEQACEGKIQQIENGLTSIEDFDENVNEALEESDIDLLKRFNERKILVNTFNADAQIKDLQQLNVALHGLSNGPAISTPTIKLTKKSSIKAQQQAAAEQAASDDQPPFQSLQEIKKEEEQLQVSKIINPNFKGQLTNCAGILPFTHRSDEKSHNSVYQHTAASSLKVNKRATGAVDKSSTNAGSASITTDRDDQQPALTSTRPFNQYRRATTNQIGSSHQSKQTNNNNNGLSGDGHLVNSSPKPGDNKRRMTSGLGGNYGQKTTAGTRTLNNAAQSRTHSYNLNNLGLHSSSGVNTTMNKDTSAAGNNGKDKDSGNQINLFNQLKSSNNTATNKRNQGNGGVALNTAAASQRVNHQKQFQHSQQTMLQQVTTQRVSLGEDTSLDLKQLTATHSDKQLLAMTKQMSSEAKAEQITNNNGKNFPNLTNSNTAVVNKRQQRQANEKQISNDLLNVQKQVNQVMSNLETFESKKRQLSAQKDSRMGGKMFQRSPPKNQEYKKTKIDQTNQNNQRPMTNQQHKRNTSLMQNDNLNNSELNLAKRMTSPPGKQLQTSAYKPRQPAADVVIGNISVDKTQITEGDDQFPQKGQNMNQQQDGNIPTLHLKIEGQQDRNNTSSNQQLIADRKIGSPNQKIQLYDNTSDYNPNDSAMFNDELGGMRGPERPQQKGNNKDIRGSMKDKQTSLRQRIKSPVVRIDLNSEAEEIKNEKAISHGTEENIANLPDANNDSMFDNINQLIHDLNNGKSGSNAKQNRENNVAQRQKHISEEDQHPSDSFDKQAKSLYFDLGTSLDQKNTPGHLSKSSAKTIDYVDGEYTASAVRKNGQSKTTNQSEKSDSSQTRKSLNKQKFIEQSLKASQISQNIAAASANNAAGILQSQSGLLIQSKVNERQRDASQPNSSRMRVPDLQLENVVSENQNFNLLRSDRSNNQDPSVPTHEANKLIPNESGAGVAQGSLQELNSNPNSNSYNQSGPDQNLLVSSASKILSASNSAYSMNNNSISNASIDPFKALCQIKDEYIFVFSGFNERKLTHCEVFDAQRGLWKEIAHIQNPRTKFAAVPISKTRILIFGGKQADGQRTADIEEYNLKNNNFKTLPFKMPKARSGFAACIKKDEARIYFCGGNSGSGSNGSVLRKFDCLDLKKGKWTRLGDMLMKRDELSVAFGPDANIYAIGGFGGGLLQSQSNQELQDTEEGNTQNITEGNPTRDTSVQLQTEVQGQGQSGAGDQFCQCLKEAERYNFSTQTWEMLPPMKESRRALAAVVLPDGIYAIGGYDGRQYLATVEKFDLNRQEWVYVKSMNTARCTLSAVASSDCQYIYVLGGYNGKALNLVERYSVMNNTWELMPPMNVKRFMHQSVTLLRQEL